MGSWSDDWIYWHFFTPTHSWSWAILEKLPTVQLLKNFPAFYGTRKFITSFTRALHLSLSWARSIQSIPSHPISLRSTLILRNQLRLSLPSGLFPSGFPTNILYPFLFSPFVLYILPTSPVPRLHVRFRNKFIFTVRSCWPHAQPPSWMITPCRLPATAYSIYSQLPSIPGGCLLPPQPEDAPCRGDRRPT
jgi:hypothetical protein